jgi:hypothetical protein
MSKFKEGDQVIVVQSSKPTLVPVGTELTILRVGLGLPGFEGRRTRCCGSLWYALVETELYGCDCTLRHKRPPAQDWETLCKLDDLPLAPTRVSEFA